MKKYKYKILSGLALSAIIGLTACTDFLNQAPEASISSTDAFINFTNFQGFTEELYSAVPDFTGYNWASAWQCGDEIVYDDNGPRMGVQLDIGNSWGWSFWTSWMDNATVVTNPKSTFSKGLWPNCWYGIRKANLGLQNLDNLKNATQEEKNLIKGQLLFFRGWFHFELMSYFGGLPYVNKALSSTDKLTLPRLSYQATADSVAKDFRAAADLLPTNWDNTDAGKATLGKNQLRITKMAALGYLGKNYLYAGSPLMNKQSTGNATFNTDYCQKAAAAFAELLTLVDNGPGNGCWIKLQPWSNYSFNFFTDGKTGIPGYPEAIFQCPVYDSWFKGCPWGPSSVFGDNTIGGGYASPNARYVQNYGMANGLPIDDPTSGYDPADPWANRDPRFYNDIYKDGDQEIKGSAPADKEKFRYAALYNGGVSRRDAGCGRTGYLLKKLTPITANNVDNFPSNFMHISYMRLADIYLMYAEAVLQGYGTATSSYPGYITAEASFNKVRTRSGAGAVNSKYVSDKSLFMGEIVRERAVELGFEDNYRYIDLRRWLLASTLKYREKTAIDFDRGTNGKPINIRERVILTRAFSDKDYWLPLKINDVTLYPSFGQNPGY
jgi:starch-binding outer membrane protein, SusD/RagB family